MTTHPPFEMESLFDELAGPTRRRAVDTTEADDHTLHIEAEHEAEPEEGAEEIHTIPISD
ncbi:hypothetical protein [Haloplanus halobius]|uniref:hypothetical protein n=1 Tax=Haloplanus halobius TaxID=2934938 RepID=UPI00200D02C4|nr:hypothetical protein [Haloplanus sp. XH21]